MVPTLLVIISVLDLPADVGWKSVERNVVKSGVCEIRKLCKPIRKSVDNNEHKLWNGAIKTTRPSTKSVRYFTRYGNKMLQIERDD